MGEWKIVKLGELLELMRSGGTPDTNRRDYYGGDIPFVTIEDMSNASRVVTSTKKKLTPQGLKNSNAWVVSKGSLLYSVYATLGLVKFAGVNLTTNQAILALIPNQRKVHNNYLYFWLSYSRDSIIKLSSQTTQSNLSATIVKEIPVSLPPLPQQRRIAEILSTVDEAIERTEQLIAKQRQIKAGLMADLFTRGITPEGHLRPPPESAPHLYKDSPLGKIPKEWEVRECSQLCSVIIDCKNRTPPLTPEGHPVIRTPNVRNGNFHLTSLVYTDSESYKIWTSRGKPVPGDIVITREAPVGEVCMIPNSLPEACLGQRMMLYRPDQTKIRNDFMLHALQSSKIQKRLDLISGGSTVGHVRVDDIRRLQLQLPIIHEQTMISRSVNSINQVLQRLEEENSLLGRKKQGLMQDLLTGRVPVA